MPNNPTYFPYPGAHPITPRRSTEPMIPIVATPIKTPVGRSPEPLTPPHIATPVPTGRIPEEPLTPPIIKGQSFGPGSGVPVDSGYVMGGGPNTQSGGVPTDRGYVLGGAPNGHIPIGQRPYEPLTPLPGGFQNFHQGSPHVLGNTGMSTQLHSFDAGHQLPARTLEGQPTLTRADTWAWWQSLIARLKNTRHFTLNQSQGAAEVSVSPGEPSGIGGPVGYY